MLKTGSSGLDEIFSYKNCLNLMYGKASTGKTTCCLLASIAQSKENKKVVFLDVENSFSLDRFKQLSGKDYLHLLDNLLLFNVKDFNEQNKIIENLKKIVIAGRVSLIIVDTIGIHYRKELKKDAYSANKKMDMQLKALSFISREYDIPVILTNQVYDNIKENKINVVGGDMIKNWCKCLIELQLENKKRKFCLLKPEMKEMEFEIREKGIFRV